MSIQYNLLILSFIMLSIGSCKKKLDDGNTNLIGYWKHSDLHTRCILEIKEDSYGEYKETPEFSEGGHGHVKGIVRCEGSILKIGPYTKFKILNFPSKLDTAISTYYTDDENGNSVKANWVIKLDLPKRYVGSGYFYKADY